MTNTIASERKRLGLSQTDLGKIMHRDRSTIGRWEADPSCASANDLKRLADLFECSVDYLLGRTEERTPFMKVG